MDGIILIDKEKGITSFKAVDLLKRQFKLDKVGHSGTLDPMATGLLIAMINKATKINEYLDYVKEYKIEVTFGIETDTCDIEGKTVKEFPVPDNLSSKLPAILLSFTGDIMQKPPAFSAIKKNGEKLYDLARRGEFVDVALRKVRINEIKLLSISGDKASMVVSCSGGTYMRSLARDLGQALGSAAVLSSIERTKIGKFSVNNSFKISGLDTLEDKIIPINEALYEMQKLILSGDDFRKVSNGVPVKNNTGLESGVVKMVYENNVIAIGEISANEVKIKRGI